MVRSVPCIPGTATGGYSSEVSRLANGVCGCHGRGGAGGAGAVGGSAGGWGGGWCSMAVLGGGARAVVALVGGYEKQSVQQAEAKCPTATSTRIYRPHPEQSLQSLGATHSLPPDLNRLGAWLPGKHSHPAVRVLWTLQLRGTDGRGGRHVYRPQSPTPTNH